MYFFEISLVPIEMIVNNKEGLKEIRDKKYVITGYYILFVRCGQGVVKIKN